MHSTNFVNPSGLDTTEAIASFDVKDLARASNIVNAHTGFGGTSLGGAAALYVALNRPICSGYRHYRAEFSEDRRIWFGTRRSIV